MGRKPRYLIAAVAIAITAHAQQPPKMIDIGAEKAPLSEAEKTELANAIQVHNFAAEQAVLDRALKAHPESAELYVMAGRIAYLEKHAKEAAEAFEHADKLKPLVESDRLTLSLAYEFSGRPALGRGEMVKLTKAAPKNAQYFYLLGRIDRQGKNAAQAVVSFKRAILLDPNLLRAYQELGQSQEELGQVDQARKTYETAAAVNRGLPKQWEWPPVDLGALLLKADEVDKAEPLFREAIRYSPRFSWAHYYLGRVLQQRGKDDDAAAEYREALVAQPSLRQAWLALGRTYTKLGNQEQADRALAMFKKLEDQENASKNAKQ
jgi:tetratricopeptide (TPR) repeat protein